MVRVLFVCLGNICRSPMAEAVFRHKVQAAGLQDRIETGSAGTGTWHIGEQAHPGTRRMLAAGGIAEPDHRARQIILDDLNDFDYVIVMDNANLRDVRALPQGRATVARLMDYAPDARVQEVPDPYLTGGYEGVYALVDEATDGLLATIQREHGL